MKQKKKKIDTDKQFIFILDRHTISFPMHPKTDILHSEITLRKWEIIKVFE